MKQADETSKKLLITGTGGYIGSIATQAFLKMGYEVVGIDSLVRGYQEPQKIIQQKYGTDKFRYYLTDLETGINEVLENEPDISAVIHFAAYCNVGESETKPELYFSNNVNGVIVLLEAMSRYNIKKLVFSSSCATYGNPNYSPIDERHPPMDPTSVYGESKALSERIIKWYGKLEKLDYVILRYFNICGASDDSKFGDSKKPSFHLMQNAIKAALGLQDFSLNYTEVDTPDGSPIRDYINVEDLSDAHVKALKYLERENQSDIFNLGTGTGNSVFEIISAVEAKTGVTLEKKVGERRSGDASIAVADNRKAHNLLDWQPTRSIDHSIETLIAWYKHKPEGWSE